jgi:MbtH protein
MSDILAKVPTEDDSLVFRVLVNHEEQHCIWPAAKDTPRGWSIAFEGSSETCKSYIEANWTDMRPLSVRVNKT